MEYTYEDDIRITSEFLDKLPITEYMKQGEMPVYELRKLIEDDYNSTKMVQESDFFEGDVFNRMNDDEFEDYLYNRYSNNICFRNVTMIRYFDTDTRTINYD